MVADVQRRTRPIVLNAKGMELFDSGKVAQLNSRKLCLLIKGGFLTISVQVKITVRNSRQIRSKRSHNSVPYISAGITTEDCYMVLIDHETIFTIAYSISEFDREVGKCIDFGELVRCIVHEKPDHAGTLYQEWIEQSKRNN